MFQGKEWDDLMQGYSASHHKGEAIQSELSSLCSQLGRLVEKKAALFWHVESFEKYLREDINPYGLRIQIFPLLDNVNPEFRKKWELNLQLCTANMMKLLIEEYKTRSAQVEKDIDEIYTKLLPFLALPAFKEHETKIKGRLDVVTAETLHIKETKFWRDKRSFQEGKAYKWQTAYSIQQNSSKGGNAFIPKKGNKASSNVPNNAPTQNSTRNRNAKPKRALSDQDDNTIKKRIVQQPGPTNTHADSERFNQHSNSPAHKTGLFPVFSTSQQSTHATHEGLRPTIRENTDTGFFPQVVHTRQDT